MSFLAYLVVYAAFGTACAFIANSRGRSAVGWFLIGCLFSFIGLILVLVLPDLKVQQERERHLADENRRLREKLKKDRMVADERHAAVQRRIGAHDVALGIDTAVTPASALPGSVPDAVPAIPPPADAESMARLREVAWYWAQGVDRQGPVGFDELRVLWQNGRVNSETLVWTQGMPKWIPVGDVPSLRDVLDV